MKEQTDVIKWYCTMYPTKILIADTVDDIITNIRTDS